MTTGSNNHIIIGQHTILVQHLVQRKFTQFYYFKIVREHDFVCKVMM